MRLFALSVLLCCAAIAEAAVYEGKAFTFKQPDGTPFQVRIWGDEFSIVTETPEGWTLQRAAGGWWCYAQPAAGGGTEPSALRAGDGDPSTLGVAKHLRQSVAQRRAEAGLRRQAMAYDDKGRPDSPRIRAMRAARRPLGAAGGPAGAPPSATTTGLRNGITLLISFPDQPVGDTLFTQAQVSAFCNTPGYTTFGNNGSVRDYFYDNSLGRLTYTNAVTPVYYVAANPRAYYADVAVSMGLRARELVIEALNSIDATFDFSQCDENGDGVIDAVNAFYAGDCPNNWSEGIWPHQWSVNWSSNDGVDAAFYQITNMGTSLELGTFCHENGHMVCDFPDIYDYGIEGVGDTVDSIGGAGRFSLMCRPGSDLNPPMVDGYLALKAGWRDPVNLRTALTAAAPALDVTITAVPASPAAPQIYIYGKSGVPTEYYLIENRRNAAAPNRDASLPSGGLAIWHVDELGNRDEQDHAKNSTHTNYELALVQADDFRHFENNSNPGDANDLWYSGNAASDGIFDDGPGIDVEANDARWWDGSVSNLIIDNISTAGASMTFRVSNPLPPPPTNERIGFVGSQVVDFEGSSGNRFIYLTVARQTGYPDEAHVTWTIAPGSATLVGADYSAGGGTVDWAAGDDTAKTIPIQVNGDTNEESDEYFTVRLSNPTGPATPLLGASIEMLIVLRNDDGASAALAASTAASIQANGTGDDTSCGAGAITGLLLGIGGLGLVRRRRR